MILICTSFSQPAASQPSTQLDSTPSIRRKHSVNRRGEQEVQCSNPLIATDTTVQLLAGGHEHSAIAKLWITVEFPSTPGNDAMSVRSGHTFFYLPIKDWLRRYLR